MGAPHGAGAPLSERLPQSRGRPGLPSWLQPFPGPAQGPLWASDSSSVDGVRTARPGGGRRDTNKPEVTVAVCCLRPGCPAGSAVDLGALAGSSRPSSTRQEGHQPGESVTGGSTWGGGLLCPPGTDAASLWAGSAPRPRRGSSSGQGGTQLWAPGGDRVTSRSGGPGGSVHTQPQRGKRGQRHVPRPGSWGGSCPPGLDYQAGTVTMSPRRPGLCGLCCSKPGWHGTPGGGRSQASTSLPRPGGATGWAVVMPGSRHDRWERPAARAGPRVQQRLSPKTPRAGAQQRGGHATLPRSPMAPVLPPSKTQWKAVQGPSYLLRGTWGRDRDLGTLL